MSAALATLMARLRNALVYVLHGTPMPVQVPRAPRAGLLNTGELILMLPDEGTLVLSTSTTAIVRDVLDSDEFSTTAPLMVGGARAVAPAVSHDLELTGAQR